jgi:hypothetical protein
VSTALPANTVFGVASKRLGTRRLFDFEKMHFFYYCYAGDHGLSCGSPSILGPSKPLQACGVGERREREEEGLGPHSYPVILFFSKFSSCRSIIQFLCSNIGHTRNRPLSLSRCGVIAASEFTEFTVWFNHVPIVFGASRLDCRTLFKG